MSQRNWIWHIFFCFITCKTEHHTLVTSTDCIDFFIRHGVFFCFQRFINTHRNISRLLINCCDNTAGICIKTIFCSCISDFTNRFSYDFRNIYISFCCNFTHNHNNTCCCACFACNTAHWVLFH